MSKVVPCLLLLVVTGGLAQTLRPVIEISSDRNSIKVKIVLPRTKERAVLEVHDMCRLNSGGGAANDQYAPLAKTPIPDAQVGPIDVPLTKTLEVSAKPCVIEYIYSEDDKQGKTVLRSYVSKQDTDAPRKLLDKPRITEDLYKNSSTVTIEPLVPRDGQYAQLYIYHSCPDDPPGLDGPFERAPLGGALEYDSNEVSARVLQLGDKLKENEEVCVKEYFYTKGKPDTDENILSYAVSEAIAVGGQRPNNNPAEQSEKSLRTYARITTGIDVAAAASADPAANFMADFSFDVPISNLDSSLYTGFSTNGYIRLASIAQPGKINGIATPATYIKPLTDSTPNTIVQSWEGNVAFAKRLNPRLHLGEQNAYWTASAIVDGGFITPLSESQIATTPVVYIANQAIYDYYTTTMPTPSVDAAKAIKNACPIPASGTFPTCYVAYVPQDRTRFFRNYAAGFTFKRYRYMGNDNSLHEDKFDFPGMATIKIGQNEYVTKGQARGLVLHADAFWPIPGILKNKWQGTLYVFGQIDTHLHGNQSFQPFLLNTAGSDIKITSDHVAQIPVQQPDRDRYRFGVAVDLTTLLKALTP